MGSAHTADAQCTIVLSVAPPNVCTPQYWPPLTPIAPVELRSRWLLLAVGGLRIGQKRVLFVGMGCQLIKYFYQTDYCCCSEIFLSPSNEISRKYLQTIVVEIFHICLVFTCSAHFYSIILSLHLYMNECAMPPLCSLPHKFFSHHIGGGFDQHQLAWVCLWVTFLNFVLHHL